MTWTPIASEGPHAPNVPGEPGAEFFILQEPVVSDNGDVAFHGFLSAFSINGTGTGGIWSNSSGVLRPLVREDEPAPGTTEDFRHFSFEPRINQAGQILIEGSVTGDIDTSDGLWLSTPGPGSSHQVQLLARTGVPTASPYMIDFYSPSSIRLSDNGTATFLGFATNNNTAVWYAQPGNVTVAAMEGSPVPTSAGLPAGTTFGSFLAPTNSPDINSSGTVAFLTRIDNISQGIFDRSIWTGTPGNLQLLAREEGPAQGLPGVDFFLLTSEPNLNDNGQVAFTAVLDDDNLSDSIWLGSPGNLQLLVKDDDPAPVGVSGVVFEHLSSPHPRLSNSGHVAFEADIEGSGVDFDNDNGIFIASTSGVEMIAREGSPAADTQAGTVFEYFHTLSINANGHVAFEADLTGPGVDIDNDEGIWAQNASGELELVARTGDWVHPITGEVIPREDATNPTALENLGFSEIWNLEFRSAIPLSSEEGTAWNDDYQLGFIAHLDNSSIRSTMFLADLSSGIEGDFDGDGDVDGSDFLYWQLNDGSSASLTQWQTNYGLNSALSTSTTVPEPSSLASLLLLTATTLSTHRLRSS